MNNSQRTWFTPPVTVSVEHRFRDNVNSVEAATKLLLAWDEAKRGPAWRAACTACYAALDGSGTADAARAAFEAAAVEAGMLVRGR